MAIAIYILPLRRKWVEMFSIEMLIERGEKPLIFHEGKVIYAYIKYLFETLFFTSRDFFLIK